MGYCLKAHSGSRNNCWITLGWRRRGRNLNIANKGNLASLDVKHYHASFFHAKLFSMQLTWAGNMQQRWVLLQQVTGHTQRKLWLPRLLYGLLKFAGKEKKCLFLFSYWSIFVLILFVFSRNKNTRKFFFDNSPLPWFLDQLNATLIEIFYFKQISRCCHLFLFRNTINRTHGTPTVERGKISLGC